MCKFMLEGWCRRQKSSHIRSENGRDEGKVSVGIDGVICSVENPWDGVGGTPNATKLKFIV